MNARPFRPFLFAATAFAAAGLSSPAGAQTSPGTPAPSTAERAAAPVYRTGNPMRDTLLKMSKRVSVQFADQRLEDVVKFFRDASGADIEADWADDRDNVGLDRDMQITLKADNQPLLDILERVLAQAAQNAGENTWQMTEGGAMEIGPKERLNRTRRVEIYDINDLLVIIPNYYDAPQIDLQQALQASQSGGGGGGQSPFQQEQEQQQTREESEQIRRDRVTAIQDLITQIVEPDQWTSAGGSGGSITYFQGTFIVNAPDYMQRQINGYTWWPSRLTTARMSAGRRYVSLNMDTGISTLDGMAQHPISAVVNGKIIRSDQPPGPGR